MDWKEEAKQHILMAEQKLLESMSNFKANQRELSIMQSNSGKADQADREKANFDLLDSSHHMSFHNMAPMNIRKIIKNSNIWSPRVFTGSASVMQEHIPQRRSLKKRSKDKQELITQMNKNVMRNLISNEPNERNKRNKLNRVEGSQDSSQEKLPMLPNKRRN